MVTKTDEIKLGHEGNRLDEDRFLKILLGIIKLEMKSGHLKWKISDLSRSTRISRPLIYYYFGKSKEQMVSQAVQTVSTDIFGFDYEKQKLWKEGRYVEAIMVSKRYRQLNPGTSEFFFFWRSRKDHQFGKFFQQLEKKYLQKLRDTFPHLSISQARLLMASIYGFVLTDSCGEEEARELFRGVARESLPESCA